MTTLKAQSELDFSNKPQPDSQQIEDLEVKDAQLIFNAVWSNFWTNLVPPNCALRRKFWLNGAPGAGKGTNTNFIMQYRNLSAPPIVVSSLCRVRKLRK